VTWRSPRKPQARPSSAQSDAPNAMETGERPPRAKVRRSNSSKSVLSAPPAPLAVAYPGDPNIPTDPTMTILARHNAATQLHYMRQLWLQTVQCPWCGEKYQDASGHWVFSENDGKIVGYFHQVCTQEVITSNRLARLSPG
jgi:hypothetical protein